jgi:hypothetical protein
MNDNHRCDQDLTRPTPRLSSRSRRPPFSGCEPSPLGSAGVTSREDRQRPRQVRKTSSQVHPGGLEPGAAQTQSSGTVSPAQVLGSASTESRITPHEAVPGAAPEPTATKLQPGKYGSRTCGPCSTQSPLINPSPDRATLLRKEDRPMSIAKLQQLADAAYVDGI